MISSLTEPFNAWEVRIENPKQVQKNISLKQPKYNAHIGTVCTKHLEFNIELISKEIANSHQTGFLQEVVKGI